MSCARSPSAASATKSNRPSPGSAAVTASLATLSTSLDRIWDGWLPSIETKLSASSPDASPSRSELKPPSSLSSAIRLFLINQQEERA